MFDFGAEEPAEHEVGEDESGSEGGEQEDGIKQLHEFYEMDFNSLLAIVQ